MSDQTSPTDAPQEAVQAPQTEGTEATQAPDPLAPINERLSEMQSGFEQRIDQLASQLQPQPQEPEADPYDPYGTFQQPSQEQYGLDPNDPRDAAILQMHQQMQELRQGSEQMQAQNYAREINNVLTQYPDLKKPEVAGPVMDSLREAGYDVDSDRPSVPPQALAMAFKAYQADQYAAQQQPLTDQQGPSLEQGGAMQPAPEQDPADALLGPRPQESAAFPWAVR